MDPSCLSLAALRQHFAACGPTPEEAERLAGDPRAGVRALARSLASRAKRDAAWRDRRARLDRHRAELAERGYRAVAGIDEAGRGPLAGPVYTSCVVLGPDWDLPGLNDSKKLSPQARAALEPRIKAQALGWAVTWSDAQRIDEINVLEATREAMLAAARECKPTAPDYLLVDAVDLSVSGLPTLAIIEGDSKVAAIAAASILAKTARDRHMEELDRLYPGYGLAEHKGYGTEAHMAALDRLGPSPIHRRSFAPVARWVMPTAEELRRRLERARSRDQLRQVGLAIRDAARDLSGLDLDELRQVYRRRQEQLP